MDEELQPFRTSDLPLAAYLYMKGLAIVTVTPDPVNDRRKIFVFLDVPERIVYEQEFLNNEGNYKDYFHAVKAVRRQLYGETK